MIPRGKRQTPRLTRAVTYTEAMNALLDVSLTLRDLLGDQLDHPDIRQELLLLIDRIGRLLDRDDGRR
jgi:hypothetical protein